MNLLIDITLLVVGFGLLLGGAELLVGGASRIARLLGVSPLLVGLTIVAYGTSLPELAVSLFSATGGHPDLALANVVGSNVCNIGLVLGTAALIRPLSADFRTIRRELTIMLVATLALPLMAMDGYLGRWESSLLALGVVLFTGLAIRGQTRSLPLDDDHPQPLPGKRGKTILIDSIRIITGCAGLLLGARWMVDCAVDLARAANVSEWVIGVTLVALGTSLPEYATSVVAALKGETDIGIGNIIGSNIFNILLILGATGLVHPIPADIFALRGDLTLLILLTVALIPMIITGSRLARTEGALLLAGYGAFVAHLFLR